MKKEKKDEREKKEKILSPETNSEDLVFYPSEGDVTFLEIVSSSPDQNAALPK